MFIVDRFVALRFAVELRAFGISGSGGGFGVALDVGVAVDSAGAGALEPVSPVEAVSGLAG